MFRRLHRPLGAILYAAIVKSETHQESTREKSPMDLAEVRTEDAMGAKQRVISKHANAGAILVTTNIVD
ncbi:unnamed protein product [Caenorhabditis auriculariae]|uniref:Uncharacterized protein n=1 Tax=Caenorhabditis auriculariae TaxID=2777116 RepID=A0A8S1GP58_9PELO|nr:unnamed protein product [Caenorhabditis auriculariae]